MITDAPKLIEANEELTAKNLELRSSNEELMVGTEEIQAATEEVETLNEELQATNEELETLNEELQATVEELNTTNDDLEARSAELEELVTGMAEQRSMSDRDRDRVGRLLTSRSEGLVVVDPAGAVVLRSDDWSAFAEGAEFSRADASGGTVSLDELLSEVQPLAARGESFSVRILRHDARGKLTEHELRGQGLPDEAGAYRGAIISISRARKAGTRSS